MYFLDLLCWPFLSFPLLFHYSVHQCCREIPLSQPLSTRMAMKFLCPSSCSLDSASSSSGFGSLGLVTRMTAARAAGGPCRRASSAACSQGSTRCSRSIPRHRINTAPNYPDRLTEQYGAARNTNRSNITEQRDQIEQLITPNKTDVSWGDE